MPAKKAPKKTPPAPTAPAKKVTAKAIVLKKAVAAKQPAAKLTVSKAAGSFYVSFAGVSATISTEKPKGTNKLSPAFDTFDQAKAAAIDGLVEAIEAAEAQLLVLKRSAGPADRGG